MPPPHTTLSLIRVATKALHLDLERRLDAIAAFSDDVLRPRMIARFAAFHLPAMAALAPSLAGIPGLDFAARAHSRRFAESVAGLAHPPFPTPRGLADALGLLYVVEGSSLGGRMILDALRKRGTGGAELAFLDPYGNRSGEFWRSFLAILERETAHCLTAMSEASDGAVRGFLHAEKVLCGSERDAAGDPERLLRA